MRTRSEEDKVRRAHLFFGWWPVARCRSLVVPRWSHDILGPACGGFPQRPGAQSCWAEVCWAGLARLELLGWTCSPALARLKLLGCQKGAAVSTLVSHRCVYRSHATHGPTALWFLRQAA